MTVSLEQVAVLANRSYGATLDSVLANAGEQSSLGERARTQVAMSQELPPSRASSAVEQEL